MIATALDMNGSWMLYVVGAALVAAPELERLPDPNVRALLNVLRRLSPDRPIRRWSTAVGSLSESEAEEMRRVIEEGCETIDPDSW